MKLKSWDSDTRATKFLLSSWFLAKTRIQRFGVVAFNPGTPEAEASGSF